ncbi:hypothetical protein [Phenylobacterium sp.]|jgi:hypothetical protein|uniref:hypothetical protein n=1 Tax=Phenylobacterium sp. TaxID=1871053 RepID=UPI0025D64431|nr:hypothetical protein [Phenylobacterium sp.]MCA3715526.1 hypothetical protein [Phenylobacterium sp.]
MGGDELTILLFFVGTGIAGVMGALSTVGARSRILWGISAVFGVAALAYWRFAAADSASLAFRTLWSLIPFVAVTMCLLVVGDREPRKPPPRPKIGPPPALNPALTVEHLNGLVRGATTLEAKRKLAAHAKQLAKIKGCVTDIQEDQHFVSVRVAGTEYNQWDHSRPMSFRLDQAAALEVVKPGDWIEFTGRVSQNNVYGWVLDQCEFVGRAEPPPKPRAPQKK